MAKFLRDEFLRNITIDDQTLELLNDFLIERCETTNSALVAAKSADDRHLLLTYIIRFDKRGYKLTDFTEVKKYYSQATKVERVIFTLDSNQSETTNRMYGTHFEIRLDVNDPQNCYIQVASDDGDVVDSVFCGLIEILKKYQNKNGLIRNTWSQLLVQIFGVAAGFVISLIAGVKIAPHLNIENPFVISFLFAFLIFSNTWGFISQLIHRFLNYSFPNIRFSRKDKTSLHWLAQALVGGLIVALTLLIISQASDWVGQVLSQYVAK